MNVVPSGAADNSKGKPDTDTAKAKASIGKKKNKKAKASANNAEPSTSSDKASKTSVEDIKVSEGANKISEKAGKSNAGASVTVAKAGTSNTEASTSNGMATTSNGDASTGNHANDSPPKKKRRLNSWLNKPHYNEEVNEDSQGNTVTSYDLDDYTSVTEIVTPGGDKSIFRWRNEPQERMEAPNCYDEEILDLKKNMKGYPMLKKVYQNPARYEETALIVYSEDMIKMAKNQPSLSVDRTFHLGPCLVTMMVFRNENLKNRDGPANKKKPAPLFVGPTLLHFDFDEEAYKVFFRHVQTKLQLPVTRPDEPVKGKGKGKRPRKKYRPFPDNHIVNAMESVFGTTLKLCDGHMSPAAIRKTMKNLYFQPWETIYDVVRKWSFYFDESQTLSLRLALSSNLTDNAKIGMRALGWDMDNNDLVDNHMKEIYKDFLGLKPRLE